MNDRLSQLEKELTDLKNQFFQNNFSGRQDFTKFSDFKSRLKVPHYASTPTTPCEIGELCEVGGKLYICTAVTPTWTLVGSQT